MAAATSTTLYAVTPHVGVNLGATAVSTQAFKPLFRTNASDGHSYIYVKATVAIGSTGTVKVGNAGSATTDAGSSGWTANVPGGAAANQFFWCKRTTLV